MLDGFDLSSLKGALMARGTMEISDLSLWEENQAQYMVCVI